MKKLFAFILALAVILAAVPASALTVGGFVKLYNKAIGNGDPLYPEAVYMAESSNIWFLQADPRCQVAVFYTASDGVDPLNYRVDAVGVIHQADVSPSVFLNCVCAAAAAFYPEIPEDDRMSDIMHALVEGVRSRSNGFDPWESSVNYFSENLGLIVYREDEGKQTFLFYGN